MKKLPVIVKVLEDHGEVVDIALTLNEGMILTDKLTAETGVRHDCYYKEWEGENEDSR